MKDFISIADCTKEELREFLDVAKRLKKQYKQTGRNDALLAGKMLAMIFEKPSLRTRVSFAVAMQHLGGAAIMLRCGGRCQTAEPRGVGSGPMPTPGRKPNSQASRIAGNWPMAAL